MPKSRSNARAASGALVVPKRKQPKRTTPGQTRSGKPRKAQAILLPEYVQCVLNPFDMPACGYPDVFNKPTLKLKTVETYLVAADAAGYAVRGFAPILSAALFNYTVTAGTSSVHTATAHPEYATIQASGQWARTVCFGVHVEYVGPAMTGSGTISLVTDTNSVYADSVNVDGCLDDGISGPAVQGLKIAVVPSMPPRYEQEIATTFMTPTFDHVYLLASGLPASVSALRVTVVRHIEMLPQRSNSVARGSATHTSANPSALVALSGVEVVAASSASWKSELGMMSKRAAAALYQAVKPLAKDAAEGLLVAGLTALAL